jgi:mRNA interferase RelE/StbE
VIQNPKIQANSLRKFENHYKVKLKSSGYRLVYEVIDDQVVVLVIAIGKREGNKIYEVAKLRT